MAKYNNENTGVLFPEANRESDSAPHATGTLEVTQPGKYRAAAWKNQSKSGPVMNLRLHVLTKTNSLSSIAEATSLVNRRPLP